ncbi:MAG TPA: enoyl-CoA hydratase/isomerase family protein [Candidatus Dormibacteraeota bacterium]|nr:enoyl-CoA hydratase/isomerase family protein [Candidatus Dormibacteraeota bacterium]
MGELVDVVREGAVARVVMHRGGNNAIAPDLTDELEAAFSELGVDPGCRVVVLQSAYERYFSVGADLTAVGGLDRSAPDAEDRIVELVRRTGRGFRAVASCPRPVIARINGHALGGGCELALCCDYRLMVEDGRSRIGQTEVGLGIMPGGGGSQRLVRLLGRARALPLLYEGTRLGAREAEALGLVHRAVAPEELDRAVDELAGRLATAATLAIALIKDAVDRGQDLPLEQALEIEARNFARAALSEDAVAGVVAFFQKTQPEFKGR